MRGIGGFLTSLMLTDTMPSLQENTLRIFSSHNDEQPLNMFSYPSLCPCCFVPSLGGGLVRLPHACFCILDCLPGPFWKPIRTDSSPTQPAAYAVNRIAAVVAGTVLHPVEIIRTLPITIKMSHSTATFLYSPFVPIRYVSSEQSLVRIVRTPVERSSA